jgi:transcriptional regulator with XRE-family HTH domain
MKARGMSANALARAAGIPPRLVHRVMSGERALALDEVERVAAALHVGVGWLLRSALKDPPPSGDVHK